MEEFKNKMPHKILVKDLMNCLSIQFSIIILVTYLKLQHNIIKFTRKKSLSMTYVVQSNSFWTESVAL